MHRRADPPPRRTARRQRKRLVTRLDTKLANIRAGRYTRSDFIIADAKDADMGSGITGPGPKRKKDGTWPR